MKDKQELIDALEKGWVSKQEIAAAFNCSEREARRLIANLNDELHEQGRCILSSASYKGYHIPDPYDIDDFNATLKAVRELKNKAISIFQRRKVLEDWIKRATGAGIDEQENLLF